MDVMILLKLAPVVIGIAGSLTYFMMRAREPVPDLELAKIVQRVRNTFCYSGAAPPDHDTTLSGLAAGVSRIESALCRRRDLIQCRARQPHVEDFG
jgi:hypothetical protein